LQPLNLNVTGTHFSSGSSGTLASHAVYCNKANTNKAKVTAVPGHIDDSKVQGGMASGLEHRSVPGHSMVTKTPFCDLLPA